MRGEQQIQVHDRPHARLSIRSNGKNAPGFAAPGAAGADNMIYSHVFASCEYATRRTLTRLCAALEALQIPPDIVLTTELVMAEVLNNVTEHAYASAPGPITVTVMIGDGSLDFAVSDTGLAMPATVLNPSPRQPGHDRRQEIPEGGFGLHIIQSLTRGLRYQRNEGRNLLNFSIVT